MKKFGKLNINGILQKASNTISDNNGNVIIGPSESDYFNNGYKEIIDDGIPSDLANKNTEKYYVEEGHYIYVKYREDLSSTENNEETNII